MLGVIDINEYNDVNEIVVRNRYFSPQNGSKSNLGANMVHFSVKIY